MSKKYKLNKEDGLKILKGAGVAAGSAVCIYLLEILPQVEFGAYTAMAVAVGGILINAVRKFLTKA